MARLLYIKASPRTDRSHSSAVAEAFLDAYKKSNPADEVDVLALFNEELPAFDLAAANAKYKIMHGKDHSPEDEQVWQGILDVIERFKSADKYVLATPMWNFSIPYRLKQYIDIIVQPGQTFTVNEQGGYEGLAGGKPVLAIYARGGEYPAGSEAEAFDLQKRYIEQILGFMGLTDLESIVIEPTLAAGPDVAAQKRAGAITRAQELARTF
jgi:FMN-dependent NADH-azoreductase